MRVSLFFLIKQKIAVPTVADERLEPIYQKTASTRQPLDYILDCMYIFDLLKTLGCFQQIIKSPLDTICGILSLRGNWDYLHFGF